MVTNAASFGRSGVHDFIFIRASAIILALYTLFLVGFVVCNDPLTYDVWSKLFGSLAMKVFTMIALIALLIHAWIGIWQVLTDYIKDTKLRGFLQFVFVITAFVYLAVGLFTVWGV